MLKKKILSLLMVTILALTFVGCDSKVGEIALESGQTAIYISKDDTVKYGVSETFEKDYYDKKELKKEIKAEVDAYNSSDEASADGALSLKKFDVSKKNATMILEFSTSYDFSEYINKYNNPDKGTFYIGNIGDNDDCEIEGKFYNPEDKEKTVSEDKIADLDAQILIVNEEMKVQIDGTIQYVSENCSVKDGIVSTAGADEGISYIVYTLE